MGNQNDLRVIKTRKLIQDAFFDLVETNGFEKITISNIANRAKINRATFYLHYQDKQALLKSLENEVLDDIDDLLGTVTEESIQQSKNAKRPFPHVIEILSYVQEHQRFFNLSMNDSGDPLFFTHIGELVNQRVIEGFFPAVKLEERLRSYLSTIRTAVISSVVNQWIQSGMKESIDEIAGLITKIALGIMQWVDA